MNETYTVKRGDTLYGISNQYGVSVMELATLNNVTANTLRVGQVLVIPAISGTNPDSMFMYTVKRGDTLYSIAKIYGTTVDEIKELNQLASNNLSVGQVIRVPETYNNNITNPKFINYTIKRGDTLYTIAQKYGSTIDVIMQDNALSNTTLNIGQNLKIRTFDSNDGVLECFGEEYIPSNEESYTTYVVSRGDTLYSIANRFNCSVSDLIALNNLTSSSLSVGQILKIPTKSGGVTYTVLKGDNLYSIARKFNTSVDSIMKKNGLTSNLLSVGQQLKI